MLKDTLQSSIKDAMKSGDKLRLGTLRLLMSAIKDYEINNRKPAELTRVEDSDILGIFRKAIKTRRDSIEAFKLGGREDLVALEAAEIVVIESFLPPSVPDSEIEAAVDSAISETGASSMKEIGAVMKSAMAKLGGRVEGGVINKFVKNRLGPKAL